MTRPRLLPDCISVRLPRHLDERFRDEAARTDRTIGDVVRMYIEAGLRTIDGQEAAAHQEVRSS